MSELTTMTELTDTEVDAVAGGFLNGLLSNNQTNFSLQIPVAVNVGSGSAHARAFGFQINPMG
jgi:hypothetical protein